MSNNNPISSMNITTNFAATCQNSKMELIQTDISKIKKIKSHLEKIVFPKSNFDLPNLLYGGGIGTLTSFVVCFVNDNKDAKIYLIATCICFACGWGANKTPFFSNNTELNKNNLDNALSEVGEILDTTT